MCDDLGEVLDQKHIIDIGAGSGKLWETALKKGLSPKRLDLLDPALNISQALERKSCVYPLRGGLESFGTSTADVAFFKQSFHLALKCLGDALFDYYLPGHTCVVLYMPHKPEWPISPAFCDLYKTKEVIIEDIARNAGKSVIKQTRFDFPVIMSRKEWCDMLRARFTTTLHSVDNNFIENEIKWVEDHYPGILSFNDPLKCLIFR
ncbi:MAG: hypothetical protein RQ714_04535 [Nitrosomonas sp.]|nr:hypothetical protein [Nitrosomonas sp.]